MLCIRNGRIHDMVHPEAFVGDILIENGKIVEKKQLKLPHRLKNVITCRNPRCITSVEPHIDQIFVLSSEKRRQYRCAYCEQAYEDPTGKTVL